jgi:hypothetical protein
VVAFLYKNRKVLDNEMEKDNLLAGQGYTGLIGTINHHPYSFWPQATLLTGLRI